MPSSAALHSYLLKLADRDVPIEFKAIGPEKALQIAYQHGGRQPAQLFEDGEQIANVRYVDTGGFWLIS